MAFTDAPPPGHTGGFGEPTCQACHSGEPLDTAGPGLRIDSLPATYEPGAGYRLAIRLTRAGLGRGGFQLTARAADGATAGQQAGLLESLDSLTRVVALRGVQYASHSGAGSTATSADTARWTVRWTAPARGSVVFHLTANASNDDASPLGDVIHARQYRAAPRR